MNARDYLEQEINFGGVFVVLGTAINALRADGFEQILIDRWVQGALHTKRIREKNEMDPQISNNQ